MIPPSTFDGLTASDCFAIALPVRSDRCSGAKTPTDGAGPGPAPGEFLLNGRIKRMWPSRLANPGK